MTQVHGHNLLQAASYPSGTSVCELTESCRQKPSCFPHTEVQHGTQHAEQKARARKEQGQKVSRGPRSAQERPVGGHTRGRGLELGGCIHRERGPAWEHPERQDLGQLHSKATRPAGLCKGTHISGFINTGSFAPGSCSDGNDLQGLETPAGNEQTAML